MIVRVQVVLQEWWCKDWIEIARSQIQQLQKVLPGYQHQESATAVQYYFMFQQKGKNLSKASSLTLDVLLNDKHKFMTKMRKDNDNSSSNLTRISIHLVDKFDPYLAWISQFTFKNLSFESMAQYQGCNMYYQDENFEILRF